MRSHFALLSFLLFLLLTSTARAQCRDDRGEPAACAIETPLSGPTPVAPPEPVESEANVLGHSHRDREMGYFDFGLTVEGVDTRQLQFSPMTPSRVAEMARTATATGAGTAFDTTLAGFSMALGFRPVPWLRFPQLRLSAGGGDLEGVSVDMTGGSQPLRASFHDLYYLRAELGAGLDVDLDPIRLYALGHIAIAGYFANATIDHATVGGLGTEVLAEDAWEAGWTVGMEIELDPRIAYSISYRHVHTGVESNVFSFAVDIRLDE